MTAALLSRDQVTATDPNAEPAVEPATSPATEPEAQPDTTPATEPDAQQKMGLNARIGAWAKRHPRLATLLVIAL